MEVIKNIERYTCEELLNIYNNLFIRLVENTKKEKWNINRKIREKMVIIENYIIDSKPDYAIIFYKHYLDYLDPIKDDGWYGWHERWADIIPKAESGS
jgi:hypothetical protein